MEIINFVKNSGLDCGYKGSIRVTLEIQEIDERQWYIVSAPSKACNVKLVKIQSGKRLAITPELTFAPDRVTCLREADDSRDDRSITKESAGR